MDTCHLVRESLSARADGEQGALEVADCDGHVANCHDCASFASALPALVRASRLHTAEAVPDLTTPILAAAAGLVREKSEAKRAQLRWTLGLVGLVQALLALVALGTDASHLGRELATWQLALGVGFVVAAWQPSRARGLFPMVAVLGVAAMVGAVGDLFTGSTTVAAESAHLVEVAGVGLVWAVARLGESGDRQGRTAKVTAA